MEAEILEEDGGFVIEVVTDSRPAVAVYTGGREDIYLPDPAESSSMYYEGRSRSLSETEKGYKLWLDSRPDDFKVIN